MPEPRKIVLVLGNGFDLDLGLKTSYKDFWESEYCPKNYPAPLIRHLNQRWKDDLDAVKWYDLENELLEYAIHGDKSDVVSKEEREYLKNNSDYQLNIKAVYGPRDDIYQILVEKSIIKLENNLLVIRAVVPYKEDFRLTVIERDKKAFLLIKKGLCEYLTTVALAQKASNTIAFQVLSVMDEYAKEGNIVNIYSFNYTPMELNGSELDSTRVHYVHGRCRDGKVIIGTRDDERISEEYDFLQKSFDDSFNPPAIVSDLQEADDIVFFGHSIGENDKQYFKALFKHQTDYANKHSKDITIFTRDRTSEIQIKRSLQRMTDSNLSTLFSRNNLQIIKTGELEDDGEKLFSFLAKYGND